MLAQALELSSIDRASLEAAAARPQRGRPRLGDEPAGGGAASPAGNARRDNLPLQLTSVVDRKRAFFATFPSPRTASPRRSPTPVSFAFPDPGPMSQSSTLDAKFRVY